MLIKEFEKQVKKTPTKIAVKTGEYHFSYQGLNQHASMIANLIEGEWQNNGIVHKNERAVPGNIGLLLGHGVDMIVCILGTLKAGKSYVPISPDYPIKRIAYMITHSEASLVLTNSNFEEKAKKVSLETNIPLLNIDIRLNPGFIPGEINDREIDGSRLAYIMYTSGSTGKPKGVMQNHQNVLYYIRNWTQRFSIGNSDRMTLFSSFCHDGSVQDMFAALLNGATLYPFDPRSQGTDLTISRFLTEEKITIWHSVPSLFNFFVNTLNDGEIYNDLRYILLGGEPFRGHEIDMFKKYFPRSILADVYGQTESSVTSIWTIHANEPVTELIIGTPLDNTRIFVVNEEGNEVEPLETGEILVACPHLSPGYWKEETISRKVFCETPDFGRVYWTGDLGRLLPDGNIEFMGRKDFQVKIRGFRVEVGEVETVILKMADIRKAAVIAKETESMTTYLCAYVTAVRELEVKELREFLSTELPDYMIPSTFVQLESMPLTQSYKIDRKALAGLDEEPLKLTVTFVEAQTPMEKIVARIWEEVLNLDEVGIHDNLFDVGGNSFDLIKINSILKKRHGVNIPIVKLFEFPTVEALAAYITRLEKRKNGSLIEKRIISSTSSVRKINAAPSQIAIIGIAGRFPGAKNIHQFWENLKNGIESISFFSDKELRECGIEESLLSNPNYVKAKGVLEDSEYFDASFFNYTPREARLMDPQLRVFHECAWEALEHAGYNPHDSDCLIGLYAGNAPNHYWAALTFLDCSNDSTDQFEAGLLTNHFSTRVSYKLNLSGPAVTVQTACSTSLVALHLACQGLFNRECDMALAGGVSISLPQKTGYLYQEKMILSPDGHVRAFDARAGGTVFSDGAGVVVLKRLDDAVADGDYIHAVIKGSAINNDGHRKVGYTAPSIKGQTQVILTALETAGVEPESISFIETHGTGTNLGDPVEIEALNQLYYKNRKNSCAISSVKSNVGHLNAAAGITGLIKTLLSLTYRLIPPGINFEVPNPGIDLINSPFYVNSILSQWKNSQYPLRAGVSSFGFGGTNAHVILEESPYRAVSSPGSTMEASGEGAVYPIDKEVLRAHRVERSYQLILLSAKTQAALDEMTRKLAEHLEKHPHINLADAAYTLQVGRSAFQYRKMFVCAGIEEARKILTTGASDYIYTGKVTGKEEFDGSHMPPGSLENLAALPLDSDDRRHLLIKIGHLWLQGARIDLKTLWGTEKRLRIPLPTYPFAKQRYWIDSGRLEMLMKGNVNVVFNKSIKQQVQELEKEPSPQDAYPRPEVSAVYSQPKNETERKLVDIWQKFFGFEGIGIQDDFFELGGDSLNIITLISRIQRNLDVLVPIQDFFNSPTIEGISVYIDGSEKKNLPLSVESTEQKEFYPLSSAQKRLYILRMTNKSNTSYNMCTIVELEGKINPERIETTFKKLINRHGCLRTSFETLDTIPIQRIHPQMEFKIEHYELQVAGLSPSHMEFATRNPQLAAHIIKNFIRPFDLSQAPLLRVGLIKSADHKHILMVDMHHIITDAFSMAIMVNEFIAIYAGKELSPLKLQYKDYSEWQNCQAVKQAIKHQEEYWLKEFEGELPTLNIPLDYARPEIQNFEGDVERFQLDELETKALKELAMREEATEFMVLLAIYNVLLAKLSGQQDIIIGVGIAGRRQEELQDIIGMFVNTLPLRNKPEGKKTFTVFLKNVKEKALLAFENQGYQFEKLVEKILPNRSWKRNPLFDVAIASQDISVKPVDVPQLKSTGIKVKPYEYTNMVSKFDISLLYSHLENKLNFSLEFSTKLFKKETIQRFIRYFKEIVSEVLANNHIILEDITITSQLLEAVPEEYEEQMEIEL